MNRAPGLQMGKKKIKKHADVFTKEDLREQAAGKTKETSDISPRHSFKLLAVPRREDISKPTLHPNINDKELLVQATLQWHNNGVHSGLFTIGDIPELNKKNRKQADRLKRGGKKRQAALQ